MAFFPCAVHGGMYKGGSSTAFIRLVNGNVSIGGKLRVCPDDAAMMLDYLREHFTKISEGDTFLENAPVLTCGSCHGDLGANPSALFANVYFRGLVESQWYGQVCQECGPAVITDLSLLKAK